MTSTVPRPTLVLALLQLLFHAARVDGLEDGLYTIQYSGCPRRYVSYARSRRYPSPVDLQDINTSNRKVVWRLKNMPGGSVSLQALERPLGASGMLSYKTSCRSRWAGVQKKGLWMMKRYVNGLIPGSSYTMVAKKGRLCDKKRSSYTLLSPKVGSNGIVDCKTTNIGLVKNSKAQRSKAQWIFKQVANPSPQSPPPPSPPPPAIIPSPPTPSAETPRCQSITQAYMHYDYDTSAAIRTACEALWRVSPEANLIDSGIGEQITCRSTSYESPSPMQWTSPRLPVCDLIEQAAADPRFDIAPEISAGCGLYFWCTNPSVGDTGLIRMQWIIQMKQTFG